MSQQNDADDRTPPQNPPDPSQAPPPPPPPGHRPQPMAVPVQMVRPPSRGRRVLSYVLGLLLVLSILCNIYLFALFAALHAAGMNTTVIRDGSADQVVAVYQIGGTINDETASNFARFRRDVRDNKSVKAVVIRVNSPGGGVSASDRIHHMIQSIQDDMKLPVVVSMGDLAASGGYYVSASADEIYAEPNTITGSVGVIMLLPVVGGFLQDHGVEVLTIRSRQAQRWKDAMNPFQKPDEQTYQNRQKLLDKVHEKFQEVVKAGRGDKLKLTPVKVRVKDYSGNEVVIDQVEPLNGHVYLADEAVSLGLVDKIGYLHNAADAAASLAGLNNPKVVQYSPRRSIRERLGLSETALGDQLKAAAREMLVPRMLLLWQG